MAATRNQELSGTDESQFEPAMSFLDLGFDSLFMTQASQAIRSQFGVKVTFRQLMGKSLASGRGSGRESSCRSRG